MSSTMVLACKALIDAGERIYKKDLPEELQDLHDVILQYPAEFVIKFELLEDKVAVLKEQITEKNNIYKSLLGDLKKEDVKKLKQLLREANPHNDLLDAAVMELPSLIAFAELKAAVSLSSKFTKFSDGNYSISANDLSEWLAKKENQVKHAKKY